MTTRYYLSQSGQKVFQADSEDHADVGRRILAEVGIIPRDYADIYDQMELLGYFRVVEFPGRVFAENSKCLATVAQTEFLQKLRETGNKVRELLINDVLFAETRREGTLSYVALNELYLTAANHQTSA